MRASLIIVASAALMAISSPAFAQPQPKPAIFQSPAQPNFAFGFLPPNLRNFIQQIFLFECKRFPGGGATGGNFPGGGFRFCPPASGQ